MKTNRWLLSLWSLLCLLALAFPPRPALAQSGQPRVLLLTADGPLTQPMAEYLNRGLRTAASSGAELVILQLDTPGGELGLMNTMVQAIRASTVPVVVYVTPRGAMAGSAGT